ncbi:MAG: FAD-binding oxidoreductase [Gammaproteobacteria bacterium]|nr:MAG: FAD-binding oxidoreductase [Gammaproteobacteria bacterium]
MNAEVVICGAGIAGIAAAYHLSVQRGVRDVVIVDELPPLSLTSDKSTECYRNWWPGPDDAMVAMTNRSIDILERLARESDNRFHLNRRGYLFATADESRIAGMRKGARASCALGAGEFREHGAGASGDDYVPAPSSGFEDLPDGADLICDPSLIRRHFPYLSDTTCAVVHARRCGWLSAQQLGMYMLEKARESGARLLQARVQSVDTSGGRVRSVEVVGGKGTQTIASNTFVNAAGPFAKHVGELLGVELPIFGESHVKLAFHDARGALSQDAPLIIWNDPVRLPWSEEEREALAGEPEGRALLAEFPAGVHARPSGGDSVLLYWTFDTERVEPVFPQTWDPATPEILLRGMSVAVPALSAYFEHLPKPFVDGGYYAKTEENRPLIGPLPVEGAYMMGAFSGFGIMVACASGELLAAHVTGTELPHYAPAFSLERYQDPAYLAQFAGMNNDGQI